MKRPWDGVEITHRNKDVDLPEGFEVLKAWDKPLAILKSNEVRVSLLLAEMCLMESEASSGMSDPERVAVELAKVATTIRLITEQDAPYLRIKEEDRLPESIAGQPPQKWLLEAVKVAEILGKGNVDQRRYTLARLHDIFRWWS